MRAGTATLTAEELRRQLDYDPTTGVFRRKIAVSTRSKVGAPIGAHGRIRIHYTLYKASRLAWLFMTGRWPIDTIDHINNDPADNRFENLREATPREQAFNRRGWSKLPKGVYQPTPHSRFRAQIFAAGRTQHLGLFENMADAKAAYDTAARELHGEFYNRFAI